MQASDYNEAIAFHYAAYRPPLHEAILKRALPPNFQCNLGLDIGCGTGYSTLALLPYCKKVIGVDPNRAMIEKAVAHPSIAYQMDPCKKFPFQENHFELISMAGSLFYAKSQLLLDEICRIGKPETRIIIYDFWVDLEKYLALLGVPKPNRTTYDHNIDFSGHDLKQISQLEKRIDQLMLDVPSQHLIHLLLAEKETYQHLIHSLGEEQLNLKLLERLGSGLKILPVNIYYTIYQTKKK